MQTRLGRQLVGRSAAAADITVSALLGTLALSCAVADAAGSAVLFCRCRP